MSFQSNLMSVEQVLTNIADHERWWNPGSWTNAEYVLGKRNYRTQPGKTVSLKKFKTNIEKVQNAGPARGCPITRSNVRSYFDTADCALTNGSADGQDAVTTAFIAMMAWGNGDTGYGAFRTAVALSLPTWNGKNSVEAMGRVLQELRGSKTSEFGVAYKNLNGLLRSIGPAFFTKFLYFASPDSNRAPILDAIVVQKLKKLKVKFSVNGREVEPFAQPASVEAYLSYVNWCEQFTNGAIGRRDIAEYILFESKIVDKTEQLENFRSY